MRYCKTIILPALAALVFACNPSSKKEDHKEISGLKSGRVSKQDFGNCDTTSKGGVAVNIAMWLPADSGSISKSISKILEDKVVQRINSYADSASVASHPEAKTSPKAAYDVFARNYNDFKKDFPEAPGCWEVTLKGDTVMVTSKALIYQLDHFSYTGGAHPNSFKSLHIFDGKSGEEKDIKSFVSDSVALLKKVESTFKKVEKLAENADLEEQGYFLLNHKFFLPANYTFTREGIWFYYNPYEIAAYARGAIEFIIPYSELEGIVKKELIL
jgi:hypothetical protein